jgi:hypothetical protein
MRNAAELLDTVEVEEQQLETQALTLKGQAMALVVADQNSYGLAGEFAKDLRLAKKRIQDYFAPIKKTAHETWKAICAKENEALKPIDEADAHIRQNMNAYLNEQERLRRAEQARLEAIERERARKEQEALLKKAAEAEAKGKVGKAEELLERAEDVYEKPVHVEAVTTVKTDVATVGAQKDLAVEVVDLKAFISELVKQDSNAFDALFTVKASALKAWAKTNGIKRFAGLSIEDRLSARVR